MILAALFASLASATPMQLTHQARVLDSAGGPLTGTVDLTIGLYDGPSGGSPLWSETVTDTPLQAGYASVVLGGGATPLHSELFVDHPTLWVALAVDGVALAARSPLSNVPFAIVAERVQGPAGGAIAPASEQAGGDLTSAPVVLAGFDGARVAQVFGPGATQLSVNGGLHVTAAQVNAGDAVTLHVSDMPAGEHEAQLIVGDSLYTWAVTGDASNASCRTLMDAGAATSNGAYVIDPDGFGGAAPFTVWCDIAGGGWTYASNNTPFSLAFVGDVQTVTTPIVPTEYRFTLYGGAGGGRGYPEVNEFRHGASGGSATGSRTFPPSTPLYVYVGGAGSPSDATDAHGCQQVAGGWNGGGRASRAGGGGGGATDLRTRSGDLHSRLLVAGGGGGCGYGGTGCDYAGGVGGGLTGGAGANAEGSRAGPSGGTQTAGGTVGSGGNPFSNGSFGKGGDAYQCNDEGGGGGGWYGGAAGGDDNRTGAGGSSYYGGMVGDLATQSGAQQRNGRATYIFR